MPRIVMDTWRRTGRTFGPVLRDMYGAEVQYVHAVQRAGGTVFLTPQAAGNSAPGDILNGFDGLVLIGGEDLAAPVSGARADLVGDDACESRDHWDIGLLQAALRQDMPVLAICRGLQILNVAFGGTLHGDIAGSSPQHPPAGDETPRALAFRHRVRVAAGSLLGKLVGAQAQVNSLHHQALADVGDGLTVTARADDGGIEAVEYAAARWCVGVQWHPELMPDDQIQQSLFAAFVTAASHGKGVR